RTVLGRLRDGVLEVEDHRVGAGEEHLVQQLRVVAGREEVTPVHGRTDHAAFTGDHARSVTIRPPRPSAARRSARPSSRGWRGAPGPRPGRAGPRRTDPPRACGRAGTTRSASARARGPRRRPWSPSRGPAPGGRRRAAPRRRRGTAPRRPPRTPRRPWEAHAP